MCNVVFISVSLAALNLFELSCFDVQGWLKYFEVIAEKILKTQRIE